MTEPRAPIQSSGVQDAFTALYLSEVGWVWNALRRLGAPEAEVEDLAHDVFVAAHHAQARFDTTRPVRPWLMGIAFRVLSDFRKSRRHRTEVQAETLPDVPADGDMEEALADRQARELLMRALDALEPDRRAVFVAHDLEGLTMPQISEALTVPLNTAYSRLRLAREQLSRIVEAFAPEGSQ